MIAVSPHQPVAISDDYSRYPEHVAQAVAALRAADVAGPYAIALGARCFTGVTETTEHGGYPVFEHLRQILDGPVVWAPAVDGAVVLSQRGGDFELTVGEDFSVGYRSEQMPPVGRALPRGEPDLPHQHTRRLGAPGLPLEAFPGSGPCVGRRIRDRQEGQDDGTPPQDRSTAFGSSTSPRS